MRRRSVLAALLVCAAFSAGRADSADQQVLIGAFNYLPGQSDLVVAAAAGVGGTSVLPDTLTIHPGDEVTATNLDPVLHTITSDGVDPATQERLFDTGNISVGSSAPASTAGLAPGRYAFHCTIHPFMHGTLVVQ